MKLSDSKTPILASREALFRFRVVSQVLLDVRFGHERVDAVERAAAQDWWMAHGTLRRPSKRTVYRWVKAYEEDGIVGLEPAPRARTKSSLVLPEQFLTFLARHKELDPRVSIPDVIRSARELGILEDDMRVDRTTAYRAARRMGLAVGRRKTARNRDMRRFAHPHRMDCILCDGKHFRAGVDRARRVAFFFLDDASRFGLHVVVGTSENTALFLRGLYEMVRLRGLPAVVYLDHGSGFIADDSIAVILRLGALVLHGEKAYPEGHGKVERFNRTALAQLLRKFDGRHDVDPDCGALELRLQHYLREQYNLTPHESLDLETPRQRFDTDEKPLRFPDDDAALKSRFILTITRKVSADNIVPVDSVNYEMPRGYAGTRVTLYRRLLEDRIACLHEGRLVDLCPVDLTANAHARRARPASVDEVQHPLPPSAADIAFQRDFAPVVDPDGGFSDK